MRFSKPKEGATPRGNPSVNNCELWVILTSGFIDYDKGTPPVPDADHGGEDTYVGAGGQGNFLNFPLKSFCEPQTVLKNSFLRGKKKPTSVCLRELGSQTTKELAELASEKPATQIFRDKRN